MMTRARLLLGVWAALTLSCGATQKSDLTASATPTGEVAKELEVVVSFSKAMVSDDHVGQPPTKRLLSLRPAIEGAATWRDNRTLVFAAATNLPPSTGYVGVIRKGTESLGGNRLEDDYKFEFTSERLTGEFEVLGTEAHATKDQAIKLAFNQEVSFEQVTQNCHYTAQAKKISVKSGPDSPEGPSKIYIVVPAKPLAADTDWNLFCKANLRGTEGNLGLTADTDAGFHTYGPLKFIAAKPSGDDIVPETDLRIELAFTNPLKAPYQLKISPKVPGFPSRCHSGGDAPPTLSCAAPLDSQTHYTITIDGDQTDIFDQKLGQAKTIKFHTTDAKPTLSMESGFYVAELARPVLPVWTRNVTTLNVTALKLTQADYHKFQPLLDWWSEKPLDYSAAKFKPVTKKIATETQKNRWGQQPLRPVDFFGGKPGPGLYYFEVDAPEVEIQPYEHRNRKALVNFTDIGLVSKVSATRSLVWATRLSTGKPLAGAKVTVRNSLGKVTFRGATNAQGVAILPGRLALEKKPKEDVDTYSALNIFVTQGDDLAFVNANRSGGLEPYTFNVSVDHDFAPVKLRGFLHTDRGLYRPGEKVHIKGLARETRLGKPLRVPSKKAVEVQIRGPRGNVITTSKATMSKFGGFWTDIELPADSRLGDYQIIAKLKNGSFQARFQVEEFRASTFEVTGKAKNKRVVRRGKLRASIAANYFYGAPVREGDVAVTVYSRPRRVSFKGYNEFDFDDERNYKSWHHYSEQTQELITEQSANLDDEGNAGVSIPITPSDIRSDADLLVRASVTSPSNEVINKSFTIPYYRSRRYHGIKTPGYFLEVNKRQKFEVLALSPSGKPVSGKATVTVRRRDWNCVWEDWGYRGSYHCKELKHDVLSQEVTFTGSGPAVFEFTPKGGGEYTVVVQGERDSHAPAAQRLYAWGDGGGSWRSDDSLTFDIVADKKEYRAGDTATLLLKTDLAQATGLVTIERDGVIEERLIELSPKVKHLKIPINKAHAPNVYVSVALVQGRMGKGRRGKPRMRMGLINLPVRPEGNTLKVSVETHRKDYRPGDEVTATVKVTDQAGNPVSAEVALTAADEGVLSLIAFKTPNPTPAFYAPWGLGVASATQYGYIKDIPGPNMQRPATGGDGAPGSLRSRFVATAVWKPGAVTNARGIAIVKFKAPDNLTAFRVMAVAADTGERFGSGDKRFTVSKPLQLHRSLPRFLTRTDKLRGGVVVHNETGKAGTATVALQTNNVLAVTDKQRTVKIPDGGRVPVLFDIEATHLGSAELTFSVNMGGESDAVRYVLPVHHPSPELGKDIAAGASTSNKTFSVVLPKSADPATASIHISVDPDGLAGIEEGLRALIQYPYGCLEQTTSKMIPMIAVRGLAESLELDGLRGNELDGFVKAAIAKVGRHQTAYGGFSLWPGGRPESYYTAYALWGLHFAKQAGYRVDETRIREGLNYLKSEGKRPNREAPYYDPHGDSGSQAFALYIRSVFGDKDTQAATTLMESGTLPIYGKAFVARTLAAGLGKDDPAVKKLVVELSNLATESAIEGGLIKEPQGNKLAWYMSDNLRTTAIVLDTLIELDPNNRFIAPLVSELMLQRRKIRYPTTQGNLYTLIALTNYAKSLTGKAPSVAVEVDEKSLISGKLSGKQRVQIASMKVAAKTSITIKPRGEVHYNIELRYREKPAAIKAQSNNLSVKREYLDEGGKPKSTFTVGDIVVVKLTLPLDGTKNHLMVSDRLPAGFEALNTRLATVGTAGAQETKRWGSFRELRDDRADFSANYAWGGKYELRYMVRAIAEGTFALPPTVAELMYEPEQNARTDLEAIYIKARSTKN